MLSVIGGYLGSWAVYRRGRGKFDVSNINASLCSHMMYAFVGITAGGDISVLDPHRDLPEGLDGFEKFVAMRRQNPRAKFLVSIGGWNQGTAAFSTVANNHSLRVEFAKNALKFLTRHGFDGLDVDWEYPSAADRDGYGKLLKELHGALSPRGLLLTAAVSAGADKMAGYDVGSMMRYLDLIFLMTYDFNGSWSGRTGMNAGLQDVEKAVLRWQNAGADPQKLVLGVPLYGRTFTLASAANTQAGAPTRGPGTPGPYTMEAGNIGYNEIVEMRNSGKLHLMWDASQAVPFARMGDQWISFDDERSVKEKVLLARRLGLAGVMAWSLETDDFLDDFPLMRAINAALSE